MLGMYINPYGLTRRPVTGGIPSTKTDVGIKRREDNDLTLSIF